ncbi:MAG: metallophosphoesterase [Magnetococcus sp. YQC-3]
MIEFAFNKEMAMGHQEAERGDALAVPACTLTLSDTDNDLKAVRYVLWLAGLCDRWGHWRVGVRHFCVVHTGDWLNKWNPDPEVVDFFRQLQTSAPDSCSVVMLVGNHEVEILQRAALGGRTRLSREDLEFIRQQDVLHIAKNILYLHGYPTLNLLTLLAQIQEEGGALALFNHRFRKVFYEGRYALFREREGLEMIGDIRHMKQYYMRKDAGGERYGVQAGRLLRRLGIDTIIHGHRPNALIQLDHELSHEVPGVRIINNDNKASMAGFGAVVVDGKGYVRFINPKAMQVLGGEHSFRKKICRVLGTGKRGRGSRLPEGHEAVLSSLSRAEC